MPSNYNAYNLFLGYNGSITVRCSSRIGSARQACKNVCCVHARVLLCVTVSLAEKMLKGGATNCHGLDKLDDHWLC